MKKFPVVALAICLSGCAWQVEMMPRDTGKVYIGEGHGDGLGGGSVSINIDGTAYRGPVMKTSSNESFGFLQMYGSGGRSVFGTSAVFGGTVYVKALLSSPDNHGLRCDLSGDGMGHLGGICVDDGGRVYDVLANR